ncbi:hypothetical protein [Salmonella sp. s58760]
MQISRYRFPLGSMLSLIPYHACATAAMHPVHCPHLPEPH